MVNSIADKEGAAGLIHMMQEEKEVNMSYDR
jgi:hypothetical protein